MARTLLVVIGTRPEAIKLAPVLEALARGPLVVRTALTGQHPDLLPPVLDHFGIVPDVVLPAPPEGLALGPLTAHLLQGLQGVIRELAPDAVLVHGDTQSTLAATLAATWSQVPVAHVEAGLRTGDPAAPFPEEVNRAVVDRVAHWWLAPTERAREQLLAEGRPAERVHVTGNPVVDALRSVEATSPALSAVEGRPYVLATCHRREHHGAPLRSIAEALSALADRIEVVVPVHPNPAVAEGLACLRARPRVHLLPPMDYPTFVGALRDAALVLTDSGGVQEEAATLGRPTLVVRDNTERPEALETGVVRVVGTDPSAILAAAEGWLLDPPRPTGASPFGDGRAGARIAQILEEALCG